MKDSGIPWIGEIPEGWKVELIGNQVKAVDNPNINGVEDNALQFKMGTIISKSKGDSKYNPETLEGYNIVDKGVIMLNGLNLSFDFISQRVGLVKERGVITSTYIAVKPTSNIDSDYLTYLFKAYDNCKAFHGMGRGLRQILSYGELRKHFLITPPLAEQHLIATFLDKKCSEIDSLIDLQEQMIKELKAYKQSVITEAVTKGLNPDAPMRDSGIEWIGSIPEHWKICKNRYLFKENVRQCNGTEISLSLSQADGLVPTSEMKESAMKSSSYENWKAVKVDDIVLNRFKAHLGVLFRAKLEGMVSFHYGVYEAITKLCPQYFEYLYHSDNYKYVYSIMSNGMVVGLQNLSNTNFYRVDCIVPPLTEQQAIADYLDDKCADIDSLIQIKQEKIDSLKEYKKSVIYEYVTGKREV
jgi:type I restriction enzyme S subunit